MPTGSPFQNLDDVVVGLVSLEERFRRSGDRRCVFLTVYRMMSEEMRERIGAGEFLNNAWTARYTVAFANLYRSALRAYEGEQPGRAPRAWQASFDNSKTGRVLVLQDVVMGVNAHINYDLALALDEVGIDPGRQVCYEDHTAVNVVLGTVMNRVQDVLAEMYAPGLALMSAAGGDWDERITQFSLVMARECAWEAAVALSNARNSFERAFIRQCLDLRAGVMAKLILVPTASPVVLAAMRKAEEGFDPVQLAHAAAGLPRRLSVGA